MLTLQTSRLTIRKFTPDDAEFVFALLNSPGWLQFIGNRDIDSIETAKAYIQDKIIANYIEGMGAYACILKESGQPVGLVSFYKRDFLDYPDVGFAFLPEYEGKG